MPAMWMDVDAALSEVPVNIVALIDDTDFKTREESVAYNQAGLDLLWNFVTSAGAYTQTAVTPTDTGGDYDWVNQGNAMYSIEIPATDPGGGSIWNDTEGYGWFSGFATGILPWSGPIIGFRAAGLNDKMTDSAYSATRGLSGTALPDAVADAAGGLPISDAGGLDLDAQIKTDIDAILTDTAAQDTATKIRTLLTGADTPVCKDSTPLTAAETESECNDALVALNLDHLMKTVTAGADMTTEIPDNTALSRILANGDTSAFTPSTDGFQPIRDRGDSAWAGAPEAVSGTIAVQTADTIFDLTATSGTLSGADDTYNNMIICTFDNSGSIYETARITDYDGTGVKRVTIDHELTFPVEDGVDTFVIYRAAYAPVGAASITEGDKNDIVDKVWDEADADHMTQGTKGLKMHHAGRGRY